MGSKPLYFYFDGMGSPWIASFTSLASKVSYFNKASASLLCSFERLLRIDLARAYASCDILKSINNYKNNNESNNNEYIGHCPDISWKMAVPKISIYSLELVVDNFSSKMATRIPSMFPNIFKNFQRNSCFCNWTHAIIDPLEYSKKYSFVDVQRLFHSKCGKNFRIKSLFLEILLPCTEWGTNKIPRNNSCEMFHVTLMLLPTGSF